MDGLLRGSALTIDGRRGDRFGKPCSEDGPTGCIEGLFADLIDTSSDDVVDRGRIEIISCDQRADGAG
jgi:hypothetical protein